ncbi:MAG: hypothetical protein MJE77_18845 [Proteobacteria bacterium]|nr:hypothetical protein [Pseudomonadota bacterium]
MKHRVYLIASEYSAPLALLSSMSAETYRTQPVVRSESDSSSRSDEPSPWQRLFFSAPSQGQSWADMGAARPPSLSDLLASAAHRALGSLHDLCGYDEYAETRSSITDLLVATMPLLGTRPDSNVNTGLIPLMLRATLGLEFDCHCQFVSGTADSGASAFASAVRIAQSRAATILVAAGQIIPSGYSGQYRIRSVFTAEEQFQGLDMMAVGDILMDALRRTHAGPGFDLGKCQNWLTEVRRCKLESARAYPAALGVSGGDPGSADRFVTRYFRSVDVAKAGCGAAAAILTSDSELLGRIRRYGKVHSRGRGKRYRNTPVVEVVGVGDGTTNPKVLARRSPLVAVTSMRQALASAADDAALPLSVYPDSAFAVLHDAFPSMEMAFLLAVGLDWQRAALRMTTWWSNPYGGLLAFGDAVGASGLVQVCKAFHVFTGDRRYIRPELNPIRRFRREGSYAFTGSIGGPLSHAVISILRGGIPPTARDQTAFFDDPYRDSKSLSLARDELDRRKRLSDSARVYSQRLAVYDQSLWLIEAATEIDARSCAQAIPLEIATALGLERLLGLIEDQYLDRCRADVIELVTELRDNYLAAQNTREIREARDKYNAGLAGLLAAWRENGVLRPDAEIHANLSRGVCDDSQSDDAQADNCDRALDEALDSHSREQRHLKALKQCVRVPAAILIEPGKSTRRLCFMPSLGDIDRADFMSFPPDDPPAMYADAGILPWWNSRATRPDQPIELPSGEWSRTDSGSVGTAAKSGPEPDAVFDALTTSGRTLAEESRPELVFLRAFFAPAGPQAAVDLAMRDLGVAPEIPPELPPSRQVPAIFYKNDIIGSSKIEHVHEAYELLGRAVQRARGWFGMYASTCAQHGDSVSLVSLDRRLERIGSDVQSEALPARTEAISNASRFARDVAEWCLGYGIRLRTVVSFGHGVPYRDVNDDRSVASDSAIRGARLLDFITDEARNFGFAHLPWIVFDSTELGDIKDAADLFEHELLAASGPNWSIPAGPSSPVALERWDDIRFTVWYRPEED